MRVTTRLKNSSEQFGWISIGFHWLVALGALGLFPLGVYMVDLGYYDPGYQWYPDIHRSLGILLAGLLFLRLIWKLINPSPRLLVHSTWEKAAAKGGHLLLYLFLFTVLISGYLLSTADGRGIQVFNWFTLPALPGLAGRNEELAGWVHWYAALTLIIFAGLHALAALKHHFVDRNPTLKRMLGIKTEK
ncbi:cytochrome b [Marinospirillum perlucidum]|uniref:cytochrome b n=1 Tax=Marinospirillum perlucidum TaxID=1982602 RepID=UPI000DF2EC5D|nr:cytochrome b [Marinospirillum perlucidum]